MMHARWINGNLAYWDTHQCRIIDAIGPSVVKYIEDFVAPKIPAADAPLGWTVTLTEAGGGESTITCPDAVGGALLLTTDANEHDGISMQLDGESFQFVSGKPCYFGIRFKVDDADQTKWMVGLIITDTEMLGGVSDGCYFESLDGSTDVTFQLEKNTNETTSAAIHTVADDTYMVLEFYFDGTAIDAWVNGTLQTRLAQTNLPDDEALTPSIEFETGEANAATMTIDWIRVVQFN